MKKTSLVKHAATKGIGAAALMFVNFSPVSAALVLPDPFDPLDATTFYDTPGGPTVGVYDPGVDVPYSLQFDDFYSYPIYLLDKYVDPEFDSAAGTGLLDVIITTRSSGQTNDDIAGDIYNIPDPITNSNAGEIIDSWGAGGTTETTMLVDDLYDYLHDTFDASIPVFTFDQNETGKSPSLLVTALVEIIDPNNTSDPVKASWSLDGIDNGVFDPNAFATAPGDVCVPDGTTTTVNQEDCFSNNVGSGAFDYMVFAPTMDLTPYDNTDYIFKVSWHFKEVDDGGEEITLTGRFISDICIEDPTLPQCQTIPEPGTVVLIGVGLLGFGAAARLRRRRGILNLKM